MKKLKILELFGGIGAPRKALENLGFDIKSIDYVEILPQAVACYNALFSHEHKPQDIKTWDLNVDILIHGSPCQDFSVAGLNDLSTGRSILYQRTLEIIENLKPRPKYIIWENVKGLLNKNNIEHFNHYLKEMERLGYKNQFRVLNSLDFGVPQHRERVFVVSIRNDIENDFDIYKLETKKRVSLEKYLIELSNKHITDFNEHYGSKQVLAPSMLKAIKNGKVKVLDPKKHCWTITTKQERWNNAGVWNREIFWVTSSGETKTNNYYYLSPVDCWLLMGFTRADFEKVKHLKERDLYALAGNSIVVPVLEAIFKKLLIC